MKIVVEYCRCSTEVATWMEVECSMIQSDCVKGGPRVQVRGCWSNGRGREGGVDRPRFYVHAPIFFHTNYSLFFWPRSRIRVVNIPRSSIVDRRNCFYVVELMLVRTSPNEK